MFWSLYVQFTIEEYPSTGYLFNGLGELKNVEWRTGNRKTFLLKRGIFIEVNLDWLLAFIRFFYKILLKILLKIPYFKDSPFYSFHIL